MKKIVCGICAILVMGGCSYSNRGDHSNEEHSTETVNVVEIKEDEHQTDYDIVSDTDLNKANLTLTGSEIRERYRTSVENVIVNLDRLSITQEDGQLILKLYIWDGAEHYYMDMDAKTGDIIHIERENSPEILDIVELWDVISPFDMVKRATEDADGEKIVSFNLYHDDTLNIDVYEIIKEGDFLYYNAATGENITGSVTPPKFKSSF